MAQTEDSIGVALSPAALRVVRLDRRSRRVTAAARAALGYAGWDEMRAHPGECASALAGLSASAGLRRGGCVATLPYSRGRVEVVTLPPMKMREIRRIVASPQLWRRHFGVTSGTHDLSWQVLAQRTDERRVSLLLTAAPKEDVAFCRELFAAAGLELRVAGLACLDYYYAARAAASPRRFLVLDECDAYTARFASHEFDVAAVEITAPDRGCILDEDTDEPTLEQALARFVAPLREREEWMSGVAEDAVESAIEVSFPLDTKALNMRLALLQKLLPEARFAPVATDGAALEHDMSRAFALAQWRLAPPRRRFRRAPRRVPPAGFIVREAPDYRTAVVHCAVSAMLALALAVWQTELRSQNEALTAHTERHASLAAEHQRHADVLKDAERRLAHWRRVVDAADELFGRQKDIPVLLETVGGAVSAGLRLEQLDCISPDVCRLTGFAPSYERIAVFAEALEKARSVSRVILGGVSPGGTDAAGRFEQRFELECRLRAGAEAA